MTTPTDMLAAKQQELAALGPESACRSDDEREQFHRAYRPLQRAISVLMNAPHDIAALDARIAPLASALDRARKAEAKVTDSASLWALQHGAEVWNGQVSLPGPLRAALTEACATCGHEDLLWLAPIPTLVAQLAALQQRRDALQAQLDAAMREREAVTS